MIDENDIDRLKEIFVPRQECQEINDEIKANLTKDLVRLAVIENQLKNYHMAVIRCCWWRDYNAYQDAFRRLIFILECAKIKQGAAIATP